MLTRMAPIRAVANWTATHSGQLGDHMPTRSPFFTPVASRALATRSAQLCSSAYVQRRPDGQSTRASWSGTRVAVAAKLAPIVSPSSGMADAPWAYDIR